MYNIFQELNSPLLEAYAELQRKELKKDLAAYKKVWFEDEQKELKILKEKNKQLRELIHQNSIDSMNDWGNYLHEVKQCWKTINSIKKLYLREKERKEKLRIENKKLKYKLKSFKYKK